jgi:nucleotide-binding universal stress UspA family protein
MTDTLDAGPILVGTDGSATAQRAVERAADIAQAFGTSVEIVTSYRSAYGGWVASSGGMTVAVPTEEELRAEAEVVLQRAQRSLAGRGLKVGTHLCEGEPSDALMTIADDLGAQMIVVGNRGMTGTRRVLGSVPNRVSHHAERAVLIVPTC